MKNHPLGYRPDLPTITLLKVHGSNPYPIPTALYNSLKPKPTKGEKDETNETGYGSNVNGAK